MPQQTLRLLITTFITTFKGLQISMENFRVSLKYLSPICELEDRWAMLTKPAFTYSKLTIETLEQGVKYVDVVLMSLLLPLYIFHTFFSSVTIVNFERVIAGWVSME